MIGNSKRIHKLIREPMVGENRQLCSFELVQELLPERNSRGCRYSTVIKIGGDGHRKEWVHYV